MSRRHKRTYAEDEYCPICGQGDPRVKRGRHRCDPRRLLAIDAARHRDPDPGQTRREAEGRRLVEGLKLWKASEEDDE